MKTITLRLPAEEEAQLARLRTACAEKLGIPISMNAYLLRLIRETFTTQANEEERE